MPPRSPVRRPVRLLLAAPLGLAAALVTGVGIDVRAETVGTSPAGGAALAIAGGVLVIAVTAVAATATGEARVRRRALLVGLLLVLAAVASSGRYPHPLVGAAVWWAVASAAAPVLAAAATAWAVSLPPWPPDPRNADDSYPDG